MKLSKPTIVLASDHAGYELKKAVLHYIEDSGLAASVIDVGTDSIKSVDYPDYIGKAADMVSSGKAEKGIVICGTGVGASMAANRHKGVRAALCFNPLMVQFARMHEDANMLALGALELEAGVTDFARSNTQSNMLSIGATPYNHAQIFSMVETFLTTPFSNEERHIRRIGKLDN